MACTNCNCGKKDITKNKSIVVESGNRSTEELDRLYLLGYITGSYVDRSRINWGIFEKIEEVLPDQITVNAKNEIEIVDQKLKNFFTDCEKYNFRNLYQLLTEKINKNDVKHFWRGYVDVAYVIEKINNSYLNLPFMDMNLLSAFLNFIGCSECDADISSNNNILVLSIRDSQFLFFINLLYPNKEFFDVIINKKAYLSVNSLFNFIKNTYTFKLKEEI